MRNSSVNMLLILVVFTSWQITVKSFVLWRNYQRDLSSRWLSTHSTQNLQSVQLGGSFVLFAQKSKATSSTGDEEGKKPAASKAKSSAKKSEPTPPEAKAKNSAKAAKKEPAVKAAKKEPAAKEAPKATKATSKAKKPVPKKAAELENPFTDSEEETEDFSNLIDDIDLASLEAKLSEMGDPEDFDEEMSEEDLKQVELLLPSGLREKSPLKMPLEEDEDILFDEASGFDLKALMDLDTQLEDLKDIDNDIEQLQKTSEEEQKKKRKKVDIDLSELEDDDLLAGLELPPDLVDEEDEEMDDEMDDEIVGLNEDLEEEDLEDDDDEDDEDDEDVKTTSLKSESKTKAPMTNEEKSDVDLKASVEEFQRLVNAVDGDDAGDSLEVFREADQYDAEGMFTYNRKMMGEMQTESSTTLRDLVKSIDFGVQDKSAARKTKREFMVGLRRNMTLANDNPHYPYIYAGGMPDKGRKKVKNFILRDHLLNEEAPLSMRVCVTTVVTLSNPLNTTALDYATQINDYVSERVNDSRVAFHILKIDVDNSPKSKRRPSRHMTEMEKAEDEKQLREEEGKEEKNKVGELKQSETEYEDEEEETAEAEEREGEEEDEEEDDEENGNERRRKEVAKSFKGATPFVDNIQMWAEGYNTFHLIDGSKMREVWGSLMPHILLSPKNLDAIVARVKQALKEDISGGAVLNTRLRRIRLRGGAQEIRRAFNLQYIEQEDSVVNAKY